MYLSGKGSISSETCKREEVERERERERGKVEREKVDALRRGCLYLKMEDKGSCSHWRGHEAKIS